MTNQNHTAATLAALPNAELDALAAKARYPETFSVALGLSEQNLWQPTRDANQALALLTWAKEQGRSFKIDIDAGRERIEWRYIWIDYCGGCHSGDPGYFCGGYCDCICHRQPSGTVPGIDARAMTIAFILAMQEVRND